MPRAPLALHEREEIHLGLIEDPTASWASLGRRVGRHPTTVAREVRRGGGAWRCLGRCGTGSARSCAWGRSPGAIRADLDAEEVPGRPCREALYQAIYSGALGVKAKVRRAAVPKPRFPAWRRASVPRMMTTVAAVASRPRLGRSCSMCLPQGAQPRELPTSNPGPAPIANTSRTPTLKGPLVRRACRRRRVVFTGVPVGPASLGLVREPVGEASGALFGAMGHVRPRRPRPPARWLLSVPPAERRPSWALYPQADTPQADSADPSDHSSGSPALPPVSTARSSSHATKVSHRSSGSSHLCPRVLLK